MASIFSRIASREIPGHFVAENDSFFAILDINPLAKGHVLVIPKTEVDYIFDLGNELIGEYFKFTKLVAKAMEKVIVCERIGVAVIGLEVPHAHIHLVPINHVGDIDFNKPKLQLPAEEMKSVAEQIAQAFNEVDPDSVV